MRQFLALKKSSAGPASSEEQGCGDRRTQDCRTGAEFDPGIAVKVRQSSSSAHSFRSGSVLRILTGHRAHSRACSRLSRHFTFCHSFRRLGHFALCHSLWQLRHSSIGILRIPRALSALSAGAEAASSGRAKSRSGAAV